MFQGIYTPIVTPFTADEEIDYARLHHNLERWGSTELDGVVVAGSNGEFAFLSQEEKLALVKDVKAHFNPNKNVIVGTGCDATRETIALSKQAADLGADAVLTLPPHYYKGAMKDDILYRHFVDVADASPVPVFIYNMPGNTGINLTAALIAKLAKHPNITGIKDTSGNIVQLAEMARDTDDDFDLFAGNAGYLLPALAVGARGATLALANILPEDCCKLVALFKAGQLAEAKQLQLKMLHINSLVTAKLGISGLKYALDVLGYQGGETRRPLRPLAEEGKAQVEQALKEYGAL